MNNKSSKNPSLLISAVSNWTSLIIYIVIGFLLTPFIINHIGKNGYGIWTLISSFIGYYSLLNLGVNSAIVRYIARYAGQNNPEALNETVSTAMSMFLITGLLAIFASFSLASPLAKLFDISPKNVNEFIQVICILGLATGINFPGEVIGSILHAHEHWVPYNITIIISSLTRVGFVILFLLNDRGIVGVSYATLISTIIGFIVNFIFYKYYLPHVKIRPSLAKWRILRKLLTFGGISFVIVIADLMRFNLDSIVIGKFVGIAEVGVYGIAALLIKYMLYFVGSGIGVLNPRFANLDGAGEKSQLKNLFIQSLSVSAFISIGIAILLVTLGYKFIIFWVGKEFLDAIPVLWILVSAFAIELWQNPSIGILRALSKHHYYAITSVFEAIANVVISIILAPKLGIVGVALGTAIPMLFVKIFIQPFYISKIVNVNIFNYIRSIIPFAFIAVIIIIIIYNMGIMTSDEHSTIAFLILYGAIIGIAYMAGSFILMNKDNRSLILSAIKNKIQPSK